MRNKKGNFYGVLLVVLAGAVLVGLYTSGPSTTGFVVQEQQPYGFDVDYGEDESRTCADNSIYGECSTIIKPKFCLEGRLVDYCELCGCDAGEVCRDRECVRQE